MQYAVGRQRQFDRLRYATAFNSWSTKSIVCLHHFFNLPVIAIIDTERGSKGVWPSFSATASRHLIVCNAPTKENYATHRHMRYFILFHFFVTQAGVEGGEMNGKIPAAMFKSSSVICGLVCCPICKIRLKKKQFALKNLFFSIKRYSFNHTTVVVVGRAVSIISVIYMRGSKYYKYLFGVIDTIFKRNVTMWMLRESIKLILDNTVSWYLKVLEQRISNSNVKAKFSSTWKVKESWSWQMFLIDLPVQ